MNKNKKTKKTMLFLSLLLLLLIIGSASATDDKIGNETISTTTDEVVSVGNDDQVSTAEDNLLGSGDINSTLKASGEDDVLSEDSELSFKELNTIIRDVDTGGTLNLGANYRYNSDSDSSFFNGIDITKSLTIDGNGHSIDGASISRIFNVIGSKVVLKNLLIKNTYSNDYYGAIKVVGDDCNINNLKFINVSGMGSSSTSISSYALGISAIGKNIIINNITFCDVKDTVTGSPFIHLFSDNFQIVNSTFKSVIYRSDIITIHSVGTIAKCKFLDCYTPGSNYNGFIHPCPGANIIFDYCIFNNTKITDTYTPTAVGSSGGQFEFKNTEFIGINHAISSENCAIPIDNCTFIGCNRNLLGFRHAMVSNSKFINSNGVGLSTEAGSWGSDGNTIINCYFYGGTSNAISLLTNYNTVKNCTFVNTNGNINGLINVAGNYNTVVNCTFINTTVPYLSSTSTIYLNNNASSHIFINASESTSNNFISFTLSPTVWVDDHTNGDGSEELPANYTYACTLASPDSIMYFKKGVYNLGSSSLSVSCNIVGAEEGVIINNAGVTFTTTRLYIKNIIFNDTRAVFKLLSGGSIDNCKLSSRWFWWVY